MKIAIFGGSFDPPHIGHEYIARQALKHLDINKVLVVPNFQNPFKNKTFLDGSERLELLKKLFESDKDIIVSDFEILKKRAVYAIETVRYLQELYNTSKIYFVIGSDNLDKLHLWHMFDELSELLTFICVTRASFLNDNYANIRTLKVDINISSSTLREKLDLHYIPDIIKKDVKLLWQKKIKGKRILKKRLEDIREILDDKKAENIEIINLKGKEYLVDAVVIATTLNSKHGFSLLKYLKEDLKPNGEEFVRVDENDDWTIVDLGDVLIHLMSESHRKKYNIEEFLSDLEKK